MTAVGSPTCELAKHLTTLLKPHVGNTEHHIYNSIHFTGILKNVQIKDPVIILNFDVESLFTKVLSAKYDTLTGHSVSYSRVGPFKHCLISIYLLWSN